MASPTLRDPSFDRSVVLLLDHDGHGALGVILNRPAQVLVASVLPGWEEAVCEPTVLFLGGPVSPDGALALAVMVDQDSAPLGVRPVVAGMAMVDLDAPPELVTPALRCMRVFAGYAGWAARQLEAEVAEDSWFLLDVAPDDAFTPDPDMLWRTVLSRQRPPLAWVASFPADPSTN